MNFWIRIRDLSVDITIIIAGVIFSLILLIVFGFLINLTVGLDSFIYYGKQILATITWPVVGLIAFLIIIGKAFRIIDYLKSAGGEFLGVKFPKEDLHNLRKTEWIRLKGEK